ncbi:MAG: hypothetical protein J5656_05820 [Clostridia bacterium]|nr:hypothetical protein [Clostridia bacterium]
MLKKLNSRSLKNGSNYIGEVEVLDTETNKHYFVVTQYGNLLYATFESSYIDSIKDPSLGEPNKIEGETYWWWDEKNTRFFEFYNDSMCEASSVERRNTITRKYARMKKPLGNIKYEIVEKKSAPVMACGPIGDMYEIKFHILDDDSYLYVFADDAVEEILLLKSSVYDELENAETSDDFNPPEPVERISRFANAKKSKYYDLYLEMEKFRDGVI